MADLGDRPIQRLESGYPELDRVLGGGVVPGSLVLVGGDPGIGKSTLLLQSASVMANRLSVLYVSAEESAQQVKLRWLRLGGESEGLQLLAETDLELVLEELEALQVAFNRVDIDGKGTISFAQLPAAFSQVGMETTEEEMDEVLALLNKTGSPDEPFSFAEFSQAADFLSPVPEEGGQM